VMKTSRDEACCQLSTTLTGTARSSSSPGGTSACASASGATCPGAAEAGARPWRARPPPERRAPETGAGPSGPEVTRRADRSCPGGVVSAAGVGGLWGLGGAFGLGRLDTIRLDRLLEVRETDPSAAEDACHPAPGVAEQHGQEISVGAGRFARWPARRTGSWEAAWERRLRQPGVRSAALPPDRRGKHRRP
jgi:hypothetical protein